MQALTTLLTHALAENHLQLSDHAIKQLVHYLDLVKTWNRVFNLTTLIKPRDMVYLHIIDSLVIQPYLEGNYCLDVGSGAGLPGIPLAIANPQLSFTLLDKNSKKTRFLTQVIAELGLNHVDVIKERVLDFHPSQCFDSILSRAFGTLRTFVEMTEHLLCENGVLIGMKGKYPEEEIQDTPIGFQAQITRLDIKGIEIERHVVCLKRKATDSH